jgi:hypothetical protein
MALCRRSQRSNVVVGVVVGVVLLLLPGIIAAA